MTELIVIRMHEAILFIYMLSVACYFFDFIQKNNRIKRIGSILLVIVFLCQTLLIGQFIVNTGRFPVQTIVEGFYFYTWLIILISLVMNYFMKSELIIFMMNLIGFIFMTIHTFQPVQYETETAVSHLMNELLAIHVTLAITAYALFLIAAIQAILYLMQMNHLKQKNFNQKFFRITDLSSLAKLVLYFTIAGFVLLLISLILGVQWGMILVGMTIWADVKVIGSIAILMIYGAFIYFWVRKRMKINMLMELNIAMFLVCMINFIIVSRFSDFHQLMN